MPGGAVPARRSLWAFGCVAAGYWLGREVGGAAASAWWLGVCFLCLALGAASRGWVCRAALAGACAALAGGWYTIRVEEAGWRPGNLAVVVAEGVGAEAGDPDGWLVRIEGIVGEEPRETAGGGTLAGSGPGAFRSTRLLLRADTLYTSAGPAAVHGVVSVYVPAARRHVGAGAGDRVRVTGRFEPVAPATNPGEGRREAWAAQEGRCGTLRVKSGAGVERVAVRWWGEGWSERGLGWLRARAARAIDAAAGEDEGDAGRAVLRALILGERDAAGREVVETFTRQGLVHLLAISGFHLVVMATMALWCVRLTGERGGLEPLIVGLLVAVYMLVVPAQTPVLRAGFMVLVLLGAEASGRRYDRLTTLGWIAVALLVWRPMDLWSLGFQLSFGIVAALLWLGGGAPARVFGPTLRGTVATPGRWAAAGRWAGSWIRAAVATSLLCWGVAAPAVAYHAGILSPLAAVTGLLVLPLTVGALWLGYAALGVGVVWPEAGAAVGPVVTVVCAWLVGLVRAIDNVPLLALRLPGVSLAWAVVATAAVLAWFRLGGVWAGRQRRRMAWGGLAGAVVWLGAEVFVVPHIAWRAAGHAAVVEVLDMGERGGCVVVRCGGASVGGGEALLWDCGSARLGAGGRTVPRAVRASGGWRVATAVVSSASPERFGALLDAVEPLGIRRVLVSADIERMGELAPQSAAGRLVRELRERGVDVVAVREGETVAVGSATLRFIGPAPATHDRGARDASLIGVLEVPTRAGERRLLLAGDASDDALADASRRAGGEGLRGEGLRGDVLERARGGAVRGVQAGQAVTSAGAGAARWVRFGRDGAVEIGSHAGR